MSNRLSINRDQLASFLNNDHDLIKRFEDLLGDVGEVLPGSIEETGINLIGVNAENDGNELISRLDRIASALENMPSPAAQRIEKDDLTPPVVFEQNNLEGVYVEVQASGDLPAGRFVGVSSVTGGRLVASSYTPTGYDYDALGIVSESISIGDIGYVCITGLVLCPTDSLTIGSKVYVDVSGGLTSSVPTKPDPTIVVGYVTRSGEINVRIEKNQSIEVMNDVELTSLADGDVLSYDSTDEVFKNIATANGTYSNLDPSTLTITNGLITSIT